MDAYALVPVSLGGDHYIRLVQDKHSDLLGVDELVLGAPVKDCARRSDHNLFLQWDTFVHWRRESRTDITTTSLPLPWIFIVLPVIPVRESVDGYRLLLLLPRMPYASLTSGQNLPICSVTWPICRASSYVGEMQRHCKHQNRFENTVGLFHRVLTVLSAWNPPEATCCQGWRGWAWPERKQQSYPCRTATGQSDSEVWTHNKHTQSQWKEAVCRKRLKHSLVLKTDMTSHRSANTKGTSPSL